MKKALLIVLAGIILFGVFVASVAKPVPILPENQLSVARGEVVSIHEGDGYDIFFKLDDGQRFYINRGVEQGFEVDELRKQLLGETVTIKYPDVKDLFGGTTEHLSKLEHQGKVIFSELVESF